jgi:hypothetical protein
LNRFESERTSLPIEPESTTDGSVAAARGGDVGLRRAQLGLGLAHVGPLQSSISAVSPCGRRATKLAGRRADSRSGSAASSASGGRRAAPVVPSRSTRCGAAPPA